MMQIEKHAVAATRHGATTLLPPKDRPASARSDALVCPGALGAVTHVGMRRLARTELGMRRRAMGLRVPPASPGVGTGLPRRWMGVGLGPIDELRIA